MLNQLKSKFIIWIAESLELFLYRRAKHIIVVTRGFVEDLKRKGIPGYKISVVSNGVDIDFFKPRPKAPYISEKFHLGNKFVVSYTGNIGLAQGFNTIFECAEMLKEERKLVFVLVGDGVSKRENMAIVQDRGLDNILFIDAQPKSEISAFLSVADVCLVPMKKTQLHLITVPAKLYESMACGKPIILSVDGEARRILEAAQAGIFVEPENSDQMAKAILHLYKNPELQLEYGQNGRNYVVDHYSRYQQAEDLENVLSDLVT
jgi:glycosyltransferase involved in cell wall biosynthesis